MSRLAGREVNRRVANSTVLDAATRRGSRTPASQVRDAMEANIGKQLDPATAKNLIASVDNLNQTLKSTERQAARDAAEKAASKELTTAEKIQYAGLAAAAGLGIATYVKAQKEADKSNNTPRTITQVSSGGGTILKITYSPAIPILGTDTLDISGTQTTPNFDGSYVPTSVVTSSSITIDAGHQVSDLKPGGTIDVTTSISAQAGNDIGKTIGNTGNSLFSGLFDAVGLGGLGDVLQYAIVGVSGSISLIICVLIMMALLKKKT